MRSSVRRALSRWTVVIPSAVGYIALLCDVARALVMPPNILEHEDAHNVCQATVAYSYRYTGHLELLRCSGSVGPGQSMS